MCDLGIMRTLANSEDPDEMQHNAKQFREKEI